MKILVLNCGSSSIKYKLYEMTDETELASGLVERIGSDEAGFRYKSLSGSDKKETLPIKNHAEGIKISFDFLPILPTGSFIMSTRSMLADIVLCMGEKSLLPRWSLRERLFKK